MDKLECPFCGIRFDVDVNRSVTAHPISSARGCPLVTHTMSHGGWTMRPPKKEQPAVTSEVEYLRGLLEKLILKETVKSGFIGTRLRDEDLLKAIGPGGRVE